MFTPTAIIVYKVLFFIVFLLCAVVVSRALTRKPKE